MNSRNEKRGQKKLLSSLRRDGKKLSAVPPLLQAKSLRSPLERPITGATRRGLPARLQSGLLRPARKGPLSYKPSLLVRSQTGYSLLHRRFCVLLFCPCLDKKDSSRILHILTFVKAQAQKSVVASGKSVSQNPRHFAETSDPSRMAQSPSLPHRPLLHYSC